METERKKIAMLINTLSIGGAERAVSNLSLLFSERFDVDIIANDSEHVDFPYKGRLISLEMPADRDRMGVLYQVRAVLRRIRRLRMRRMRSRL